LTRERGEGRHWGESKRHKKQHAPESVLREEAAAYFCSTQMSLEVS